MLGWHYFQLNAYTFVGNGVLFQLRRRGFYCKTEKANLGGPICVNYRDINNVIKQTLCHNLTVSAKLFNYFRKKQKGQSWPRRTITQIDLEYLRVAT